MSKPKETEQTIVNVQEVYTRLELFVDRNRRQITMALGGVVVLVAGFIAYVNFYKTPRENEAANAMWKAQQWLEMDSVNWALNGHDEYLGFEQVAEEYGGTKAGKLAKYYLGIIYRDKGEYEKAIGFFEDCNLKDPALAAIALGNVGDLKVELKELEEGASLLEKAGNKARHTDSEKFLTPVFYLKSAKVYLELGEKKKAKKLLRIIKDDYANFANIQTEYAEASKLYYMVSAE